MTVITAMKFNEKEGAIIADERSSGGIRQYDIATKIHILSNGDSKIITGGSGAADILYETIINAEKEIKDHKDRVSNARVIVDILTYALSKVKRNYLDGYLKSSFGLEEINFQTGIVTMPDGTKSNIDATLMQKYYQIISGGDQGGKFISENEFLVLANDNNGVEIYNVAMSVANPLPIARPYESIGTGRDMADGELYNFFEKIPRDQRNKIDPVRGISALLSAVESASARNIGVGGTPIIYIIKDSEVITPNENNSRLASEIVKGAKRDLLPQEFRDEALKSLIYEKSDFKEVEGKMWNVAKDKKALDLLLRGFKI